MSKVKQGNVLAITYDIWISGTKLALSKKQCINRINVVETVEGADSAVIEIQDPKFEFIEDDIFLEENTIKIKMGWSNTTYKVEFSGFISVVDISFNSDGIPKLTLTCMDKTHKMNKKKKNKTFKNTTNAAVVKNIVKDYGFTAVVDKSYKFTKQETITQSNQTDIEFITKLAGDEVHPFTARLDGKKFRYEKMGKLTTPKMTLTYREYPHEIISFTPRINKESKQVEIKKSSINTRDKSTSTTKGSINSSSGSSSSGSDDGDNKNSNKGNGSYTYDPQTKSWSKK